MAIPQPETVTVRSRIGAGYSWPAFGIGCIDADTATVARDVAEQAVAAPPDELEILIDADAEGEV